MALPHRCVRRQSGRVGLRKPAADEEAVAVRQATVAQGVEENQPRARAIEGLDVVLVIEAESLVPGDGDPDVMPSGAPEAARPAPGARRLRRPMSRSAPDVDALGDRPARRFDDRVALRRLARRREAEVALAHDDAARRVRRRRAPECPCSARAPAAAFRSAASDPTLLRMTPAIRVSRSKAA